MITITEKLNVKRGGNESDAVAKIVQKVKDTYFKGRHIHYVYRRWSQEISFWVTHGEPESQLNERVLGIPDLICNLK